MSTVLSPPFVSSADPFLADVPGAIVANGRQHLSLGDLRLSVHDTPAEIETVWRSLEAQGLCSAYQRFDWVSAYVTHALDRGDRFCAVVVRRHGQAVALFALTLTRRFGLTTAQFAGDRHANYHLPILERDFASELDAVGAGMLLGQIAQALGGIDRFRFINQPTHWEGLPNPFAAVEARPQASNAYRLALVPCFDTTLNQATSAHARKNYRRKRARLEEFGACRTMIAQTAADRARILEAFHAQKTARFAQQGLVDVFADPRVGRFLADATTPQGNADPALVLAAYLIDDRIAATYIAARHQKRFSGMATSFAADDDIQRYSPGEMLLLDLIALHCRDGYTDFDLGVGEAQYKSSICNETDEMTETDLALTWRGRIAKQAAATFAHAKGRIKQNATLYKLAHRAMRRLQR